MMRFDKLVKKFDKRCRESGILKELRFRRLFVTMSQRKKEKRRIALSRRRRAK